MLFGALLYFHPQLLKYLCFVTASYNIPKFKEPLDIKQLQAKV